MSMIYELSRAVDAKLQTRKFPVRVVYGTRRLKQEQFVDSVICFARDHDLGDEIRAPQGAKRNPRRRAVRDLGVEIKFYVRASVPGTREEDHEFDCEQVVDALVCAILRGDSSLITFPRGVSRRTRCADSDSDRRRSILPVAL